jgi:NADH dehydrogenase FAD-containing subunit
MSESSPARPSVLVVGGGYGGITVARGLDDVADVTLVDPRDAFVHNIAALRALVDPAWLEQIYFPYESLLPNGRTIRDRVVRAEPGTVALASGDQISADYLVLATGSRYPFPAKPDADDTATTRDRYRTAHEALQRADRVLILGAGPTGLELAGEIRAALPDKQVTIIDAADDILSGPFKPELRDELRAQLDGLGIELRLGTTLSELPASAPNEHAPFSVKTSDGDALAADIWFRCFGVVPVSDYVHGELAAARDSRGNIAVGPDLRVGGQERVFAIGDIIDLDGKMAGRARAQGDTVVENIRALIAGETALTAYEPMPPALFVPLGPTGGAGQLPGAEEISGPEVVAELKGRDLMVDAFREMFVIASPAAG